MKRPTYLYTEYTKSWRKGYDLPPQRHERNRKEYEEDLKKRQREHLDSIQKRKDEDWQPCLHDECTDCIGTGLKKDGSRCVHNISCPCPKCTTSCISYRLEGLS